MTNYARPIGIMGGPCLHCGGSQPEHVGLTCDEVSVRRRDAMRRQFAKVLSERSKETAMTVRAKMKLASITSYAWNPQSKALRFQTEYDMTIPEDQRFQKATPNGHIEMSVDNPVALEQFELGKNYYVTFEPVES